MGRKLKRVPFDFNWPLNKIWGGYINPFYAQRIECECCQGTGLSPKAKLFQDQWYGNADFDPVEYGATPLTKDHPAIVAFAKSQVERSPEFYGSGEYAIKENTSRLFNLFKNQWCHHLIQEDVDAIKDRLNGRFKKQPTPDEVNTWSIDGMGHDSINSWICVKARCEREGVEPMCSLCDGSGNIWPSKDIEKECEEWESTEPPEGDGYQLWENTSEGSPITPVFKSLEELCEYCENNCSIFASIKTSKEEWMRMLGSGIVSHKEGNMIFI